MTAGRLVVLLAAVAGAATLAGAQATAPAAPPWPLAALVDDGAPRPHRRAFLVDDIGAQVGFDAHLDTAEARAFFDQGLALLHGLDFHAAERSFRQAAALQPSAAIPWVGAAFASGANATRAGWFAEEAAMRRAAASDRERRLVDALAAFHEVDVDAARAVRAAGTDLHEVPRRQATRPLVARSIEFRDALLAAATAHPDDHELTALHAFTVWRDAALGLLERAPDAHREQHVATARSALLQLARSRPRHPARLHLAALELFGDRAAALAAVAATTRFAPRLVGPWLIAGRLTESLHRHADAHEYYEAALRVAHATLAREQRPPHELAAHRIAAAGLVRAQIALGRADDARAEFARLAALPRAAPPGRENALEPMTLPPPDPLTALRVDAAIALRLGADHDLAVPQPALAERVAGALAAERAAGLRNDPIAALARLDLGAGPAADHSSALATLLDVDREFPDRFPILARIAERAAALGDTATLRRTLERLRTVGGTADLGSPLGALVGSLAVRDGSPVDWRLPRDPLVDWPRDLGPRPDLANLGPRHWEPGTARDWTLSSPDGRPARLAERRDRPQVVILYLGFGCLHCIEALRLFQPLADRYREAGIDLVAIGTDTVDNLRRSLGQMSLAERLAVPMLSDRRLRVFREWLAFDEFEFMPLHGTFLIDTDGRVRWREIGDAPFERPAWLLEESRRLLRDDR